MRTKPPAVAARLKLPKRVHPLSFAAAVSERVDAPVETTAGEPAERTGHVEVTLRVPISELAVRPVDIGGVVTRIIAASAAEFGIAPPPVTIQFTHAAGRGAGV